jgi:methanol metabolism-related c-type cytochrome
MPPILNTASPQEGPGDPIPAKSENGKHFDPDGDPTYKIDSDGTVDWYTYSGYRRYHSECHICHGPDGEGSSLAPQLIDSVKELTYAKFQEIVVNGKKTAYPGQTRVMPAFGMNKNVMCYLDDIYIYLRARAQGNLPRGRPVKHAEKPSKASDEEKACLGP